MSYGLGVLASWGTLSAIQGSIYVPVLTIDLLIMLGVGIIYFIPIILFFPLIFTFFYEVGMTIATPFFKKRWDREKKIEEEATEAVKTTTNGKTKKELVLEYPFLDKYWSKEEMIYELVKRKKEEIKEDEKAR